MKRAHQISGNGKQCEDSDSFQSRVIHVHIFGECFYYVWFYVLVWFCSDVYICIGVHICAYICICLSMNICQ